MLNFPVETTKKVADKVISADLITYKNQNNTYVPDTLFKLNTVSPLSYFRYYDGVNKDEHYANESILRTYDSKNNIMET